MNNAQQWLQIHIHFLPSNVKEWFFFSATHKSSLSTYCDCWEKSVSFEASQFFFFFDILKCLERAVWANGHTQLSTLLVVLLCKGNICIICLLNLTGTALSHIHEEQYTSMNRRLKEASSSIDCKGSEYMIPLQERSRAVIVASVVTNEKVMLR